MLIIVGDFNVDFDRQGPLVPLLLEFMSENCLVASDLSYRSYVGFTYERDDGSCRSWIDHILCSTRFSSQISSIQTVEFGSIPGFQKFHEIALRGAQNIHETDK